MATTKLCSHCKMSKSVDEFARNRSAKDGLSSWCKQCKRDRQKSIAHLPKMTGTKICSRCGEEKTVQEFYAQKSSYDGRQSWCIECTKAYNKTPDVQAKRKAYSKTEAHKQSQKKYLQSEHGKQHMREYEHSEARLETRRLYRQTDAKRESQIRYAHSDNGRAVYEKYRQTDTYKQYKAEWIKTPKGKALAARSRHKRQSQIRNTINDLTAEEWEDICKEQDYKCAMCGEIKPLTRDHIIPLSRGGGLTRSNVQGLCRNCNSKKGASLVYV